MGWYIPKSLERLHRWAVWRAVSVDGKTKKQPYMAHSLLHSNKPVPAKTNTPKMWGAYTSAMEAKEYGDCNGLGFLFVERDGLVGIDLDNCVDDCGDLSPFGTMVISLFGNTYTEYSQSGKGLHIICRGKIPKAFRSDKQGEEIEIYSDKRYFAITGIAYTEADCTPQQTAIDTLCKMFNISDKVRAGSYEGHYSNKAIFEDTQVYKACAFGKNGETFKRLWEGEQLPQHSTPSHADIDLMSKIWWRSRNREQTIRLFKKSARGARDKAQRVDYIEGLVNTAILSYELWKQEHPTTEESINALRARIGARKTKSRRRKR